MIIKHRTHTTYAWDLGIFNQAFYTTTTLGKTFYYTCELHFVQSGSFFGIHFSPILYAILPVYSLFPGPETRLIIESLILALAAYPLFLISTKLLDSQKGLLISIIYLANPVIQGINSYDFHVQIFFPILIFSAQYLFLEEKWIEHLVAVLLVLMIQEQAVYIIFFYGVSLIVSNFSNIIKGFRDKQFLSFQILTPFIVLLMSISWFFVSSSVIHFFNPEIPIELKAGKNFRVLGALEPTEIPSKTLENPVRFFLALSYGWYEKITYLLYLFAPMLFTALIKPILLVPTVPWFALSFVSNYSPYFRLGFQYPAYVIPFIFFASIQGFKEISLNDKNRKTRNLVKLIISINIIFTLSFSPLSPLIRGTYPSPAYEKIEYTEHTEFVYKILEYIPENASILTQDNIFPHLSSNINAYVLVPPSTEEEFYFYKKTVKPLLYKGTEYILLDLEKIPKILAIDSLNAIEDQHYGLMAYVDNIYLLKRNYSGNPLLFNHIERRYDHTSLLCENSIATPDPQNWSNKIIIYNKNTDSSTIWYGPYDILSPGKYIVTFIIRGQIQDPCLKLEVYTEDRILNYTYIQPDELSENWCQFSLEFTIPTFAKDVEFRGFSDKTIEVALKEIKLIQIALGGDYEKK